MYIFRHSLLRLTHMDYAGTNCGDLTRSMLNQFKAADRVLQQALGEALRTVMGASTATREALCQVQERLSDDIARVGRSLHGFEYPDALEQAVRQNWEAFKASELMDRATPRRFGRSPAG